MMGVGLPFNGSFINFWTVIGPKWHQWASIVELIFHAKLQILKTIGLLVKNVSKVEMFKRENMISFTFWLKKQ